MTIQVLQFTAAIVFVSLWALIGQIVVWSRSEH